MQANASRWMRRPSRCLPPRRRPSRLDNRSRCVLRAGSGSGFIRNGAGASAGDPLLLCVAASFRICCGSQENGAAMRRARKEPCLSGRTEDLDAFGTGRLVMTATRLLIWMEIGCASSCAMKETGGRSWKATRVESPTGPLGGANIILMSRGCLE